MSVLSCRPQSKARAVQTGRAQSSFDRLGLVGNGGGLHEDLVCLQVAMKTSASFSAATVAAGAEYLALKLVLLMHFSYPGRHLCGIGFVGMFFL